MKESEVESDITIIRLIKGKVGCETGQDFNR
jgi:hypothetical protein